MTPLWTAADAMSATGGQATGWDSVSGISIDTRELVPGDLFVSLQGISHDGHVYVAQALEAGAGAAIVSHRPEDVPADAPLLMVGDTLKALRDLAAAARARTKARVIGVTGSVGKTSTKDMLRAMLAGQGQTHAAVRSFNNHWGVPLTLARMPADTDFAVIEIGMNNAGEITPLSQLARLHVALITTVEAVHLENLGTVEAIADAKAEIFDGLELDGVAVLNADNPHYARLARAAGDRRILAFGRAAEAYRLDRVETSALSTVVQASVRGQPLTFKLATPGAHFALNALGALAAAESAGADLARAALDLARWQPPSGRGARIHINLGPAGIDGRLTLLDESYNANPASLGAALDLLAGAKPEGRGRKIAFLGDMLELGPAEDSLHAAMAEHTTISDIDKVHCCGHRMAHLHRALPPVRRGLWLPDSSELATALPKLVDAGDVCMVKGSLGAKMARVVDAIKGLGAVETQDVDGGA
ncbi:MAG: UDP-N-acetylmuramoylalanyl-D-glutamyl-2,6-diaminopimelate--D-alanyl-D-alanine ligase [Pseudomonadota bacterium]